MSEPPEPSELDWRTVRLGVALRYVTSAIRYERSLIDRRDRIPLKVTDDELVKQIDFADQYTEGIFNRQWEPPSEPPVSGHWAIRELLAVLHRALLRREDLSPFDVVALMRSIIITNLEHEDAGGVSRYVKERAELLHMLGRLVVELVDRDRDVEPAPWWVVLYDL